MTLFVESDVVLGKCPSSWTSSALCGITATGLHCNVTPVCDRSIFRMHSVVSIIIFPKHMCTKHHGLVESGQYCVICDHSNNRLQLRQ